MWSKPIDVMAANGAFDDVGRVVPSAEPDLDHGHLHPARRKITNAAAVVSSKYVAGPGKRAVCEQPVLGVEHRLQRASSVASATSTSSMA